MCELFGVSSIPRRLGRWLNRCAARMAQLRVYQNGVLVASHAPKRDIAH